MSRFDSIDKILDFAIEGEQKAQAFYADLAEKTQRSGAKELFESFVAEEKRHEEKLKAIKNGEEKKSVREEVTDLKISDYIVDVEPSEDMDYQKSLVIAMKREKKAFLLYNKLASMVEGELKETFLDLANEEAKHKLYFETEYDEQILKEN